MRWRVYLNTHQDQCTPAAGSHDSPHPQEVRKCARPESHYRSLSYLS